MVEVLLVIKGLGMIGVVDFKVLLGCVIDEVEDFVEGLFFVVRIRIE